MKCFLKKSVFLLFISLMFLSIGSAYENWDSGAPDGGTSENCAKMNADGTWEDVSCDSSRQGLCQVGDSYETTSSMNWESAQDECASRGGNLVMIDDNDKNSEIASQYGDVWIGYTDFYEEGSWQWIGYLVVFDDLQAEVYDADRDGIHAMGRKTVSNFSFKAMRPEPAPVQVAFVLDDTGSMGGQIDGVKNNFRDFFNDLGDNARGAIVTFKDSAEKDLDFTSDQSQIESTLDGISASGGGDAQEAASEGIDKALNDLDWGPGRRKVVIMVVGAGVHECDTVAQQGNTMSDRNTLGYAVTDGLGSGCGSGTVSNVHNDMPDRSGGDDYRFGDSWDGIFDDVSSEVEISAAADLYMHMPDQAWMPTDSQYDESVDLAGSETAYIERDLSMSDGFRSYDLEWYPTVYGDNEVIKTGNSYVNFTVNGETTIYNFTETRSEDLEYIDLNVSEHSLRREDGEIDIEVNLRNKGSTESKERQLILDDEDDPGMTNLTIPPISPGGSHTETTTVAENNWTFRDAERVTAYFDRYGIFDTYPGGQGEILEPDENNNIKALGYPPNLLTSSPDAVEWNDTFSLNLDFDHYFPDQVSGNYTAVENGSVLHDSRSFNKPAEGIAATDNIDNNDSRIFYNFSGRLVGPEGAVSVYDGFDFYIENPLPEIYGAEPRNMETVSEDEVWLRAYVRDENSVENPDDLSVTLYDQETGSVLHSEQGLSEGIVVDTEWPQADEEGKTYRWNLTVSDRWDTISQVFRFQRRSTDSYRVVTESEEEYSSIVGRAGASQTFEYTVRNPLDFDKNDMEISLSGVNASFRDGSTSKSYSLPNGTSKTFEIIIKPEESAEGQEYLMVETLNGELNVSNTEKIPVYVRKDSKRTYEASGIGWINVVVLLLVSVYAFAKIGRD